MQELTVKKRNGENTDKESDDYFYCYPLNALPVDEEEQVVYYEHEILIDYQTGDIKHVTVKSKTSQKPNDYHQLSHLQHEKCEYIKLMSLIYLPNEDKNEAIKIAYDLYLQLEGDECKGIPLKTATKRRGVECLNY